MEFIRKNQQNILQIENCELDNGIVPLLKFSNLEETGVVKHGFSTRLGGVSEGIFASMNVSFTRGDDKQAVEENYRRIAKALGVEEKSFVCSDQTHTTNVRLVTGNDCGKGVLREKDYTDVDGLITNEPGVTLATFYADCVPLFFVDPVHCAIGLSHSGWKGTVGRMGKQTILAMQEAFGTKSQDLVCAIGPSICQDCYEISEDVAQEFYREFLEHGDSILEAKENGKYQLDLWKVNAIILEEAGVLPQNIAVTNICTCCNPDLLFSHRASRGKRGNLGAFLCLK